MGHSSWLEVTTVWPFLLLTSLVLYLFFLLSSTSDFCPLLLTSHFILDVDGEPDGFLMRICPFDPVFFVSGNVDVITWLESNRNPIPFKKDTCSAFQQDNPLVPVLVVPLPGRGCLSL